MLGLIMQTDLHGTDSIIKRRRITIVISIKKVVYHLMLSVIKTDAVRPIMSVMSAKITWEFRNLSLTSEPLFVRLYRL